MVWQRVSFCGYALALICLFPQLSSLTAAEPTPAQKLVASPGLLVIAHRGNSSEFPENTLPAFQSAVELNSDLVELDYHHTADGVPVVLHDATLDRTTNAAAVFGREKIEVARVPLAALAGLDAGSWFDPKFRGTGLPTLAESLDAIQTGSTTLIERKAGDAQTLVKLLEQKQLTDRVAVQAFDWDFVATCRRLSPTLVLGTLHGKPATEELIRSAAATGADLIVWNHEKIDREHIDLIHALGKKAWVYTVDDPQRAAQLIAAGIDGIITNKPVQMLELRDKTPPAAVRH
jgi:glycerophosphoryl diester phosphodiesterase